MKVFRARDEHMKHRLEKCKASGGLNRDGSVNWKHGVYCFEWASKELNAKLTKIKHIGGDEVAITETAVERSWVVSSTWADYEATIGVKGMTPTKLCKFFSDTKTGPFAFKKLVGFNKDLDFDVSSTAAAWHQERAKESGAKEQDTIAEGLRQIQAEKEEQTMEEARGKAKSHSNLMKRRRTLSLQPSVRIWRFGIACSGALCAQVAGHAMSSYHLIVAVALVALVCWGLRRLARCGPDARKTNHTQRATEGRLAKGMLADHLGVWARHVQLGWWMARFGGLARTTRSCHQGSGAFCWQIGSCAGAARWVSSTEFVSTSSHFRHRLRPIRRKLSIALAAP